MLEVYFSRCFINRTYFKVCFEVRKIRLPFFHVDPYYKILAYLMIHVHIAGIGELTLLQYTHSYVHTVHEGDGTYPL